MNYKNSDNQENTITESAEDCQTLCQSTTGCTRFKYIPDDSDKIDTRKKCFLKYGISSYVAKTQNDMIIGPAECNGEPQIYF